MSGFVQNAKTLKWEIEKDPDAILDYVEDWTSWLTPISDTISTASVTATSDSATAVVDSSVVANGTHVHAWVRGGVAGETIALRFRINTVGGRRDDRTVYLKVKER